MDFGRKFNRLKKIILIFFFTMPNLLSSHFPTDSNLSNNDTQEKFNISNPKSALDYDLSTEVDASFIGENEAHCGVSVSHAGDVNNDGYDDFIIGGYQYNNYQGKTYLFYGNGTSISQFDLNMDIDLACNASFIGESTYSYSGYSIGAAGDVNNDNYDDIIIGAYNASNKFGKAYIVYGNESLPKDMNLAVANASFIGEKEDSWAGFSVAGIGDFNKDSYDDFIIGAKYYENELNHRTGRAYIIYGNQSLGNNINLSQANITIDGEHHDEQFAQDVAYGGDINNDGFTDVLMSAHRYPNSGSRGRTYIFYGNNSYPSIIKAVNANATITGKIDGIFSGRAISGGSDINHDSYDDIIIGAYRYDGEKGKAFIYLGNDTFFGDHDLENANITFTGENNGDHAGSSVEFGGDFNGDGISDFVIGADQYSGSHDGKSYLFYGNTSFPSDISVSLANKTFTGEFSVGYQSGYSHSLIGDYNGDGLVDLLIGAYEGPASERGKSYLIYGELTSIENDFAPPTFSNLTVIADPLELGENVIIRINVTDPSGFYMVNQTLIEFDGLNHTMTHIAGEMFQYNQWIPDELGISNFTIFMEDKSGNWNSTGGSFDVVDTIAPTYSNLIESADPFQIGGNETISIKVYDSGVGIDQVLLEYDNLNHTMNFTGIDTWQWTNWKINSVGLHNYTIFMNDTQGNTFSVSDNITATNLNAPIIENLTFSTSPLEIGEDIEITVDIYDDTSISHVFFELNENSWNMTQLIGNQWSIILNLTMYNSSKELKIFTIHSNDSANTWNSLKSSFEIIDSTPPTPSDLLEYFNPIEFGNNINISLNVTDIGQVETVLLEFDNGNHTMSRIINSNTWQYVLWTPDIIGIHTYTIYMKDESQNWNVTYGSFSVSDTILPGFLNLTENFNPLELGGTLNIMINTTDIAGIKQVKIEFEGLNHSMSFLEGNTWQYDLWTPSQIGTYIYYIFAQDNHNNWNKTEIRSIVVQDTIHPPSLILITVPKEVEQGEDIIFDWLDGIDLSGISSYSIIISTESDISAKEAYILNTSIINTGSNSSFFQFKDKLPSGKYYYYIYQIDGAGLQSEIAIGEFQVLSKNYSLIYVSIIFSILATILIIKMRFSKEMPIKRKVIPLKIIHQHVKNLNEEPLKYHKLDDSTNSIHTLINNLSQENRNNNNNNRKNFQYHTDIDTSKIKIIELYLEGAYLEAMMESQSIIKKYSYEINFTENQFFIDFWKKLNDLVEMKKDLEMEIELARYNNDKDKVIKYYNKLIPILQELNDIETYKILKNELAEIINEKKI